MAHHDPGAEIAGPPSLERAAIGAVVALAFALSALLFDSAAKALLYALSLAIFAAPGIPLARRWFQGPLAILAGAALGYLASSLAAAGLARLGWLGPVEAIACSIGLYVLARALSPFVPERPRDGGGWSFLAAALLLPVLLVAIPFYQVGTEVPGGVAFRAYFSADLMTHLSVTAELQKGATHLENPFYGVPIITGFSLRSPRRSANRERISRRS
jgi:hypothetical protein